MNLPLIIYEKLLLALETQLAKHRAKENIVFLASHGEIDAKEAQEFLEKNKLKNL